MTEKMAPTGATKQSITKGHPARQKRFSRVVAPPYNTENDANYSYSTQTEANKGLKSDKAA